MIDDRGSVQDYLMADDVMRDDVVRTDDRARDSRASAVRRVTLYSRRDCHLCDQACSMLVGLGRSLGFDVHSRDIDDDPALAERYGTVVPVAAVDGRDVLAWPFSRAEAGRRLAEALWRDG